MNLQTDEPTGITPLTATLNAREETEKLRHNLRASRAECRRLRRQVAAAQDKSFGIDPDGLFRIAVEGGAPGVTAQSETLAGLLSGLAEALDGGRTADAHAYLTAAQRYAAAIHATLSVNEDNNER